MPTLVPARMLSWVRPDVTPSLATALALQNGADPIFCGLFTVRADGTFEVEATESTGSGALDALALEAARRWTFRPATCDGLPVDSYLRLRIEFKTH